jgi:hypothetical protein
LMSATVTATPSHHSLHLDVIVDHDHDGCEQQLPHQQDLLPKHELGPVVLVDLPVSLAQLHLPVCTHASTTATLSTQAPYRPRFDPSLLTCMWALVRVLSPSPRSRSSWSDRTCTRWRHRKRPKAAGRPSTYLQAQEHKLFHEEHTAATHTTTAPGNIMALTALWSAQPRPACGHWVHRARRTRWRAPRPWCERPRCWCSQRVPGRTEPRLQWGASTLGRLSARTHRSPLLVLKTGRTTPHSWDEPHLVTHQSTA